MSKWIEIATINKLENTCKTRAEKIHAARRAEKMIKHVKPIIVYKKDKKSNADVAQ